MIYTVTLNPALDKTVEIPGMALDTVNRITEMRTDPGGKGINVSKVIAKLGGESCAVGILGGGSGKMLEKLLEGEPFATRFRFVEGQTRTNLKIIDREGHTNTDINEPGLTVTDADLDALLNDLLAEVHAGDIVVLAGSLPKGAPQDTYRRWTATCKKAGALYLRKGSTIYAEGLRVPVGSTVGAGDSVVAALAYAEAQGLSEEEAVRLSTAAGAANVMCSGTQAAERAAVETLLPKVRFSRLRP